MLQDAYTEAEMLPLGSLKIYQFSSLLMLTFLALEIDPKQGCPHLFFNFINF